MSRTLSTWAVLALAIGLSGATARAQVLYGSISGSVVDQAGSAVPSAKIRIVAAGTGQSRETETDDAGSYSFVSIPGDTYDVVVSKSGFANSTIRSVNVTADSRV